MYRLVFIIYTCHFSKFVMVQISVSVHYSHLVIILDGSLSIESGDVPRSVHVLYLYIKNILHF